jgi:hypothetical protein
VDDDVKRFTITVDRRKTETDLCDEHRKPIEEAIRYAHRKPRTRDIEPLDPADIPKLRK